MMNRKALARVIDVGERPSFWLLVFLMISLMVLPIIENASPGRVLGVVGYTGVMILTAISSRTDGRRLWILLLLVTLPIAWATLVFDDNRLLYATHCMLGSGVLWSAGGVIFVRSMKTLPVTIDSVFGATSAYLIFGMAWALAYRSIYTIAPNSLPMGPLPAVGSDIPVAEEAGFSEFVYYSFVTMSTLGYGDITPQGRLTCTLSWVQSVTGQFYVAIVIAWLVNALPQPGEPETKTAKSVDA